MENLTLWIEIQRQTSGGNVKKPAWPGGHINGQTVIVLLPLKASIPELQNCDFGNSYHSRESQVEYLIDLLMRHMLIPTYGGSGNW